MGGARNQQPLTAMPRSEPIDLHCTMNDFLETKVDAQGNSMSPKRGNSRDDIARNFTRPQRLRALAEFSKGPGSRFSTAARDFFAQHPGLR